jgi:PBP1b-binding outer membrane lipoprotein LpoB
MKKKLLLSTFLTLLVTGCIANNENTPEVTENPQTSIEPTEETNEMVNDQKQLAMTGTVHFLEMEGGFYGIITDKGAKLLPMGLDKKYMVSGTIINFNGEFVKDRATIQQWGQLFRIESIKLIKMGKSNRPEI